MLSCGSTRTTTQHDSEAASDTPPILELWLEQTVAKPQKGNHNSKIGGE
jgi:hypothetical protein